MFNMIQGTKVARELGHTDGKARVMYDADTPFFDEWEKAGKPEYLQHAGDFFRVHEHEDTPGCFLAQLFPYGLGA